MALLEEDGTGLVGANSYASYAGYAAYWSDRGDAPAEDQTVIEAALIKATDYLDIRFAFRGRKLSSEQALQWPRACAYGEPTADYPCGVPLEGVPLGLQKATYEYAKRALAAPLAPDPVVSASGVALKSTTRKVGPIETRDEFVGSSATSNTFKPYPSADNLIRWLIVTAAGRVWRA